MTYIHTSTLLIQRVTPYEKSQWVGLMAGKKTKREDTQGNGMTGTRGAALGFNWTDKAGVGEAGLVGIKGGKGRWRLASRRVRETGRGKRKRW